MFLYIIYFEMKEIAILVIQKRFTILSFGSNLFYSAVMLFTWSFIRNPFCLTERLAIENRLKFVSGKLFVPDILWWKLMFRINL